MNFLSAMKYCLVCVGIFIMNLLSAQNVEQNYQHHDIMISYGAFTIDQFLPVESTMLTELYPDKRYVRDHYAGSGIASFSYRHITYNEVILWGISAGYNQTKATIYNVGTEVGELERQFISVAIDVQYRYVNSGSIQLYSGVALGYQLGNETLTPPSDSGLPNGSGTINRLAWQVNAMGIRIGKTFGGFAEFGFGYKGIVNVGLSAQLY